MLQGIGEPLENNSNYHVYPQRFISLDLKNSSFLLVFQVGSTPMVPNMGAEVRTLISPGSELRSRVGAHLTNRDTQAPRPKEIF